jgi:hypothetical protein
LRQGDKKRRRRRKKKKKERTEERSKKKADEINLALLRYCTHTLPALKKFVLYSANTENYSCNPQLFKIIIIR